jgi:HD-like signal output (HDOD) protein
MTADAGREIREYVRGMYRSRTLPSMLGKIVAVVKDENSSPRDLLRVISHDPALAERVIRVANSAMFGHSGDVRDLPHAVMFLGYERVRAIALGMGVMDVFPARNSYDVQDLWRHGYEVAFLSSVLSDAISMATPAESFLCGLIHDIGRVIFFERDRERYYRIGTDDDMFGREVELFGCTHAEAGGWYAEHAELPEDIILSIRHHHQPSRAPGNPLGVSIVALADAFSRKFCPRVIDDGVWTPEHDAVLLELGLDDEQMIAIRQRLEGLKYDIRVFFGEM